MEEIKKKSLNKSVIIIFVIVFLIIFIISFGMLFQVFNSPRMPNWFLGFKGLLAIFAFNMIWILMTKFLFKKYLKIKVFLIFLSITISASVLAWWIIGKTSIFDHIFG